MMNGRKKPPVRKRPRESERGGALAGAHPMPTIEMTRSLLLPYQRKWVEDSSRFLAGVWCRQTGKSFSTACIVAESMVFHDNTVWMIAAPSERQSLEALAKVKDWIKALGAVFSEYIEALQDPQEKATSVVLPNGSRCIAVPGKPDTVRGMSCNVWMDEFAFFEKPDETWKAILPSIANPMRGGEKRVILTSTYNGTTGRFYDICNGKNNSKAMSWSVHVVSRTTAAEQGCPIDFDALAAAFNDPAMVAQELDCIPTDAAGQLLPTPIILRAESESATLSCPLELYSAGRDLRLGIDIGRMSDPTVVWAVERIGEILFTREVLVLAGVSHADQLDMIRARARGATRISLDYTGLGIGIGDMLTREFGEYKPAAHLFGKVEKCNFTAALKREIFPRLRETMEAARLKIPREEALRSDLSAMRQVVTAGGYSYEAPRTRDGHSDRCTAAALAVRAAAGGSMRDLPVPMERGSGITYTLPDSILRRPF